MAKTLDPRDRGKVEAVFWTRVTKSDRSDGCWVWTGTTINGDYGAYGFRSSTTGQTYVWLAHRLAWTLINGPLDDSTVLDHLCGNEKCVRPEHLKRATNEENAGREYRRTVQCRTNGCPNPSDRGRKGLCQSCYRRAGALRDAKRPTDVAESDESRTEKGNPAPKIPPPGAPNRRASESVRLPVDLMARLLRRSETDPDTGCILWNGELNSKGYGRVEVQTDGVRRRFLVHRLAWQLSVGEIPQGWVIDHLCQTKRCINVEHLACVTHGQNSRRAGELPKPPRSIQRQQPL